MRNTVAQYGKTFFGGNINGLNFCVFRQRKVQIDGSAVYACGDGGGERFFLPASDGLGHGHTRRLRLLGLVRKNYFYIHHFNQRISKFSIILKGHHHFADALFCYRHERHMHEDKKW